MPALALKHAQKAWQIFEVSLEKAILALKIFNTAYTNFK